MQWRIRRIVYNPIDRMEKCINAMTRMTNKMMMEVINCFQKVVTKMRTSATMVSKGVDIEKWCAKASKKR
jgi:hypothetical protein